jgi:transposase
VFAGKAARGKSSLGWFYGFKLHLVVNTLGEVLNFACTPGNIDDRQPVPALLAALNGSVFGDKGYLSRPLHTALAHTGVRLVTDPRSNMSAPALDPADRRLLRRRFLIETIFDQLKNDLHIDHTRHRSVANFFVNLWAGLVAYAHQPRKPALAL